MRHFFVWFFLVYGAIHLYFLAKLRPLCPRRWVTGAAAAVLSILLFARPLASLLGREGYPQGADLLMRLGYYWLGLLFLFLCFSLALEGIILAARLARRRGRLHPAARFLAPLVAAVVSWGYGYYEAGEIRVERLSVASERLSRPLRVVQISDLHVGPTARRERIERAVRLAAQARPDLIVSTGDLVDGRCPVDNVPQLFATLKPPLGKYAILGNHEYYSGRGYAEEFFRKSGFVILRDEGVMVRDVRVVGADDPARRQMGLGAATEAGKILPPRDGRFVLFLRHRPDISAEELFDLQLSGHVHKGQIFPFNLVTWFFYPVTAGHTRLASGATVYVSRGTGTWGPPIRVLAPPEVTVIDLVPATVSAPPRR